jgi:hypothetical protein
LPAYAGGRQAGVEHNGGTALAGFVDVEPMAADFNEPARQRVPAQVARCAQLLVEHTRQRQPDKCCQRPQEDGEQESHARVHLSTDCRFSVFEFGSRRMTNKAIAATVGGDGVEAD